MFYEYRCEKCLWKWEEQGRVTDPTIRPCPRCGGPSARLVSMPGGHILKGPGFYVNDYKKKEKK